jgi:hypothetical protein
MGNERNTQSCSVNSKDKCPGNRYCSAAIFKPLRSDGPKGLDPEERVMSALKGMRLVNKARKADGRPRAELYKPEKDANGVVLVKGKEHLGWVKAFACYPKTDHQKNFAKENEPYRNALTKAMQDVCTVDNGYDKSWKRNKCVAEFIKNDPDVKELEAARSNGI